MIQKDKWEGSIMGVKIFDVFRITRLLFVDNVLLIRRGVIVEWKAFKDYINAFWESTGLQDNVEKLTFLTTGVGEDFVSQLKMILPFKFDTLETDLKYLVYFLQPNNYLRGD